MTHLLALALPLLASPQALDLAQLSSPTAQQDGRMGCSLALDGDTLLAAAPGETVPPATSEGAVHVFVQAGGAWAPQAILVPNGPLTSAGTFGVDLDLDGDTAAVGVVKGLSPTGKSSGAVAVFVRSGTTWSPQAWLEPTGGSVGDFFGRAVSLSGDRLAVGATRDGPGFATGAVFVFERTGNTWSETAKLTAGGPGDDYFGTDVSLWGDQLAVGEPAADIGTSLGAGAVNLFTWSPGGWTLTGRLTAPTPTSGAGLGGRIERHQSLLAIAALGEDNPLGPGTGSVHLFREGPGGWSWEDVLYPPSTGTSGGFGWELTAEVGATSPSGTSLGDTVAASGFQEGLAHIYRSTPSGWVHEASFASASTQPGDLFGNSLGLQGGVLFAGAPLEDDPAGSATGEGLVHLLKPCSITTTYCTAGTSAAGCRGSISSEGTPSATASSGFTVRVDGAEGSRWGLLFLGTGGRQAAPWGNGSSYQCVVPPVRRAGAQLMSGSVGVCDGTLTQDLNALWCATCPKPAANPGPGTVAQVQAWYRDPLSTSNQTTSLSNALELTVCP